MNQTEGQADDSERKQNQGISRVSLKLFLCGFAAIIIAYAGIYPNFGHRARMVSPWMMLVGIVLLAFAAKLELRNHHWKKWKYNGVFLLSVACGLILSSCLAWIASQEPLPGPAPARFSFSVRTPEMPFLDRVMLTNDCLVKTNPAQWGPWSKCCLIVPLKPGETNTSLIFAVKNESANVGEFVEVDLQASTNLSIAPHPPWSRSDSSSLISNRSRFGHSTTNSPQEWTYNIPYALLPNKGQDTPLISLQLPDITASNCDWPMVSLYAESKDTQPHFISFNLMGSSFPLLKKPIVIIKQMETNGTEWIRDKDLLPK